MARPKIEVDEAKVKEIKSLAAIGCSFGEIASVTGISVRTLHRRFGTIIKEGIETGNVSLRRAQFRAATTGNVVMMIWLGKQRLGQREKVEHIDRNDNAAKVSEGLKKAIRNDPQARELAKQLARRVQS
jgi:DNA-binding Lrp family transcriptional regulator